MLPPSSHPRQVPLHDLSIMVGSLDIQHHDSHTTPTRFKESAMTDKPRSPTYRDAGVDIDAGNALVERIKDDVRRTHRPGVLGGLGGFGGLFEVPVDRYRQ